MAIFFIKPFNFRWTILFILTILASLLAVIQLFSVPSGVSTYEIPTTKDIRLSSGSIVDLPFQNIEPVTLVSMIKNTSRNQNSDAEGKEVHEAFNPTSKDNENENEVQKDSVKTNSCSGDSSSITTDTTCADGFQLSLLGNLSVLMNINNEPVKSFKNNRKTITFLSGKADPRNHSEVIQEFVTRIRGPTITLSEINSMLLNYQALSKSEIPPRINSILKSAKSQAKSATIKTNTPDLYRDLFRNISMFKRSYELMERMLKIYIYKDGEKPIFHQPRLRGIYSSEGWFMKLLEGSKHYIVKDPRKAHLFYLPFSSEMLRWNVGGKNGTSLRKLESYLTNYVDSIKTKYRFWNRTGGADHFFVACHDWAPRITTQQLSSCIQALCNANVARGFKTGKDVSVPVTYIRSGNNPLRDIGGEPPSQRTILAFFAGDMHGYLRPILLQYWGQNKSSDMKIFGQMERSVEGKSIYRDYMKRSKYCICAKGFGVHTPRVVESIYYECIPVIISDNYVPPLFEVLDWGAFSVFVLEKEIPSLRDILISIPERRYLEMQNRVRMVKRHFLWHKVPEKYDLFHMILHSVWFNRLSQYLYL